MVRYIAVDSGKFATKFAEYDIKKKCVHKYSIRTRVSDGDFRDDAIEKATVVVEIDGKTYKVGNGARGAGVNLDTDKKSEDHKISILTAIAMLASSKEKDEIYVAVGLPAREWASVSKRMDFKEYILPDGDITITIKKDNKSEAVKKTFVIKGKYVFPESIGALFMDETIGMISSTSIIGVLDIGNLDLNATLWQGKELLLDMSATEELGGSILIQSLAQELSTITACDELVVANILKQEPGDRCLPDTGTLKEEQLEESRKIIKRVLKTHADRVKKCCRSRQWSLDVIPIIAIGGTSKDIADELKESFTNIMVLEDSQYCNVLGYLRMLCARIPEIGKIIPIKEIKEEDKESEEKDVNKAEDVA